MDWTVYATRSYKIIPKESYPYRLDKLATKTPVQKLLRYALYAIAISVAFGASRSGSLDGHVLSKLDGSVLESAKRSRAGITVRLYRWAGRRVAGFAARMETRPRTNSQDVQYTGDCANGQGTCTLANGDKYEGAWVNKLYHGHGKYSWSRGDTYEGEWRKGVIQGQGRMRFSSSAQYDGLWTNAEPHGPGTWPWSCGGSWRGSFAKGRPVKRPSGTPGASGAAGEGVSWHTRRARPPPDTF